MRSKRMIQRSPTKSNMKIALVAFSVLFAAAPSFSQGWVNFVNGSTALVSVGGPGQSTLIAGPQGSYYFGLLTAPLGTTDPAQFAFTDVYATNRSDAPGRLYGGLDVGVPGWLPGDTKSFLVAGWSASLGHDWNAEWQSGIFAGTGYFGLSAIGSGYPGGPGGVPTPGLQIFGGFTGIQTGFNLLPVPEPSVLSLGIAGGALLLARLYRRIRKQPI